MVILFIGLLIFGRRLPEVARSLGKSVNEFKKGLRDFQESVDEVVSDVNKIKTDVVNDVASEVKEASGVDNAYDDSHGYQYGGGETVSDTGKTESETVTEPKETATPSDQNPTVENIEPMK